MKTNRMINEPVRLAVANNNVGCCKRDFAKILEKPCFLEMLRLEQQRAQRANTSLSIIVLSLNDDKTHGLSDIREMLKYINSLVRETDAVGYLDPRTISVLLPYTDEEGAQKFAAKITESFNNTQLKVSVATYPDEIFLSLAKNGCVSVNVLKLMLEDTIQQNWFMLKVKRAIDIIGALAGLAVFSPVMILTAVSVKLDSPGPIIFKQNRLGRQGVPFTFYKFRSMRTDTNDQIHRDYVLKLISGSSQSDINQGNEGTPIYKIKADPRITSVGKFIRKTSIDELPQLYNVLKGDMSLVGPRPPLAYEAEKYETWHLRRILEMKPGITGLWQVEGRSRTLFDDAVRLDVRYLQTWSVWLDIKIILKTVQEVLRCTGAV